MQDPRVQPLEKDVYLVRSYGTSKEDIEEYRVDLSDEDFGCSCKNFYFNGRRTWEQMRLLGTQNKEACACKHIKDAMQYRHDWQQVEDRSKEKVGQICIFMYNGMKAGQVTHAELDTSCTVTPQYNLTVKGRSGRTLDIHEHKNQVYYVENWDVAKAYLIANT